MENSHVHKTSSSCAHVQFLQESGLETETAAWALLRRSGQNRMVPELLRRPMKSLRLTTVGEVLGLQRETGLWPLSKVTGRGDNSCQGPKRTAPKGV